MRREGLRPQAMSQCQAPAGPPPPAPRGANYHRARFEYRESREKGQGVFLDDLIRIFDRKTFADPVPAKVGGDVKRSDLRVVVQFDVGAGLRRHLVRRLTDKLAATNSNCTTTNLRKAHAAKLVVCGLYGGAMLPRATPAKEHNELLPGQLLDALPQSFDPLGLGGRAIASPLSKAVIISHLSPAQPIKAHWDRSV